MTWGGKKSCSEKRYFLSSLLIVVFLAGLALPASGEGRLDKIVIAHRGVQVKGISLSTFDITL